MHPFIVPHARRRRRRRRRRRHDSTVPREVNPLRGRPPPGTRPRPPGVPSVIHKAVGRVLRVRPSIGDVISRERGAVGRVLRGRSSIANVISRHRGAVGRALRVRPRRARRALRRSRLFRF